MPNYTVCAYDWQGLISKPGSGESFTYTSAAYGDPHELTVNDDDQWADSKTPDNENGADATYVSGSGEPSWVAGQSLDHNAVHSFSGSDGSTITVGWLTNGSGHQMMATAPFQEGVTYTEIPGSTTSNVPASTYEWSSFDFSHPTAPPCFTKGMEIRTIGGPVAVENLQAGDKVWTLDHGFQEVRFVASRKVVAQGSMAPVKFKKGIIGNTKDIVVSQKHRFHIASLPAALRDQFGSNDDTLLQARQFCDGVNVTLEPSTDMVEYFHIMFDDHELVECYGTISESWQPTRKALEAYPEQAAEMLAIFPELATRRSCDPGALARHEIVLKDRPLTAH